MARETEGLELDEDICTAGVRAVFGHPERGLYYVGEINHIVAGSMLITYEWSDWRNGVFWWIQSVYVDPDQRGRGVFRALHNHVFLKAKADPRVCGLRLYVERENHRAQTVYQRVGFCPSVYRVFEQDFVLGHEVFHKQT